MACSENKNPLQRSGTSQQQRLLAALQHGYVNIDERDFADWIVFANEFAAYLNYYDPTNTQKGNWKPFFENDIAAVLGMVSIQDIDEYRGAISDRFAVLKADEFSSNITSKRESLGSLFGCILALCKALDKLIEKLPPTAALKTSILDLIRSKLQPALERLLTYYKGGKALNLVKEKDYASWKVLGQPLVKAATLINEGLSERWIRNAPGWEAYYNALPENRSIYGDVSWTNHRKINHAANHNLFFGIFDQFLLSYSVIITQAEKNLLQTLHSWNDHLPHYALFLSFLKLFRFAKDHLNTLTQRHLDFYYNDVLRLAPKKAEANNTHVIFELARQTDRFFIARGALLKAGKDSAGKEVLYALEKDVLFNKAKIARLMTLYKGSSADNLNGVVNAGRLFASPVANSADGLGSELESAFKEWHPLLSKSYSDGAAKAIHMPKATVGFAIASHYLNLTEGERLINIKFSPSFSSHQLSALSNSLCFLTAEKEWYQVSSFSWSPGTLSGTDAAASVLSFTLPGDAPAILNYTPQVHGGTYRTDLPLFKLILKNDDAEPYSYDALKDIVIANVQVEVNVGYNSAGVITDGGLKNLVLSNDVGILDPSKPFLPFGHAPKKGSSFIVGSEEVFKKKDARIQFRVEWKDLPPNAYETDYPKVSAYSLQQGVWKSLGAAELAIFHEYNPRERFRRKPSNQATVAFPQTALSVPQAVSLPYTDPYKPFGITSTKGFIKFMLAGSFGHQEYQKDLTEHLIALANGEATNEPSEPYTPTIQKLSLHYQASTMVNVAEPDSYENREIQYFHIYPFGNSEQHQKLTKSSVYLIPRFVNPANHTQHNEAEFYIGFENLVPGQSVHVLFQVLEGTTNPLLEKPEKHLTWSYLSQDKWKAFTDQELSDHTSQLLKSGIISFVLPAEASSENTMLPPGFIWIKASVTERSETVCKLLAVLAQAALVRFFDQDNAADFLDSPLPAGRITKLKESTSAIKKIEQPFASFGGRANEAKGAYYLRVSERLRHKSRAITIWDFEHLILEAFPNIHKVKCLNHTRFEGEVYNEVAPGHVTIITIPSLLNRNDANPLRPYTRQDVLNEIYHFLIPRLSCHVKLHVRQPRFEEVRLDFKLKLFSGLEFNYYHDMLQREITEFLTPWAYGSARDVAFGGKVHKSVLIDFIEERSYVDYITEVKMYQRNDETSLKEGPDTDTIEASTARSILVSAAAKNHTITEIVEHSSARPGDDCIDKFNRVPK